MARTYYKLIVKKLRTLDDVPDTWKEETKALLDENGYDENGDKK